MHQGDESAKNILLEKYRRFAWKVAKSFFDTLFDVSFTLEDLVSIAFASVDIAVKKYQISKNKTFYVYWKAIASNSMRQFVKEQITSQEQNKTISLDTENDNGGTLHDSISSDNIDEQISLYNSLMSIINNEKSAFSLREKKVISLFLDGYEIKEISKMLKISRAKVYRAYHSAIDKIRRSLIIKK